MKERQQPEYDLAIGYSHRLLNARALGVDGAVRERHALRSARRSRRVE